jgi:hypothetical protein
MGAEGEQTWLVRGDGRAPVENLPQPVSVDANAQASRQEVESLSFGHAAAAGHQQRLGVRSATARYRSGRPRHQNPAAENAAKAAAVIAGRRVRLGELTIADAPPSRVESPSFVDDRAESRRLLT